MKFFVVFILLSFNLGAASLTLKESFEAARLNMETLKRSSAQIKQALERKNQARAGLLPTISAVGNETRIDAPEQSGVNRAFVLTRQYSAGLRLQQPLLRGGVFSGLQSRNEEILLAQFQKNATEITLYQLVISAYFNLQNARLDLQNLAELLKFSKEREKEMASFTKVGRSRKTELVQAQTQTLTSQTQYRQGEMALQEAEQTFEFYTGLPAQDLAPLSLIPKELPDISIYNEKLKQRPDILARLQDIKVADKRVEVSKGGHFPNVDLISNYYFDRTGVLQTSEWDVAVVVNIPLFQGGSVAALVRESTETKRIAELNSYETIRAAKRDLAILYQNYHQMQEQLETMKQAMEKSKEAYQLNMKDYRFGQVTNLEVLQSLNLFIQTKRSYNDLITSTHLTYMNLEASIGVLP